MGGTLKNGTPGHDLTVEELQKGGNNSVETRRRKASLREAVKWVLSTDFSDVKTADFDEKSIAKLYKDRGMDITKTTPEQLSAIGLWIGSVLGNATNFRTLGEFNDEIDETTSTPTLNIQVIDNRNLEKTLYEENQSGKTNE